MYETKLQAADGAGEFTAYVWEPEGKTEAGAVVLIQEIFGVNDALRATGELLAAQGFIAIAPDLFWRQEPGVNITDKTEAEWQKAFALMNGFDQNKGVEDLIVTLAAARELPACNGSAGTLGFCLGGRLAVLMATRSDSDVNISYYGVGLDNLADEFDNIQAPLMLHIAEQDEYATPAAVEKLLDALEENEWVDAFIYPGVQHAFARVNGMHFDARAATIANGRTTELLAEILE
jgi:carboxymethylenebutenolidase